MENLAPKGTRSPDRPARSESLYRLSHAGPLSLHLMGQITDNSVKGVFQSFRLNTSAYMNIHKLNSNSHILNILSLHFGYFSYIKMSNSFLPRNTFMCHLWHTRTVCCCLPTCTAATADMPRHNVVSHVIKTLSAHYNGVYS